MVTLVKGPNLLTQSSVVTSIPIRALTVLVLDDIELFSEFQLGLLYYFESPTPFNLEGNVISSLVSRVNARTESYAVQTLFSGTLFRGLWFLPRTSAIGLNATGSVLFG